MNFAALARERGLVPEATIDKLRAIQLHCDELDGLLREHCPRNVKARLDGLFNDYVAQENLTPKQLDAYVSSRARIQASGEIADLLKAHRQHYALTHVAPACAAILRELLPQSEKMLSEAQIRDRDEAKQLGIAHVVSESEISLFQAVIRIAHSLTLSESDCLGAASPKTLLQGVVSMD